MRHLLLLPLLLLITGCASYEYDLVKPEQKHIGEKPHVWLELPAVSYEMVTYDSKLVVFVHNDTDDTLTLRGDKSYVIDKTGASRVVQGMAIAPKSFVKLILPPPRPYVYDDGPRVGFGFGAYDGGGVATGVGVGTSTGGGAVQNLDQNVYWDWDGEGEARFHFVYSDSKQTYEHDLLINRKKK